MIAVEDPEIADVMGGLMGERVVCQPCAKAPDQCVMRDAPQADNRLQARQCADPTQHELSAGVDLCPHRFVLRRNTANGIGDHRVRQRQTVIDTCIEAPIGEAELGQGRVEQIARVVARKRTPGPVRPGDARGKAEDQKPGSVIAE